MNLSSLPALFISAGILLGGCTDSGSPAEKGGGNGTASTEAPARTRGTRVDSLNGIPGHRFGEPLSAFPGLVLFGQQEPGSQSYAYPAGKPESGWFGKRRKEYPNEFYTRYIFADGKFVAFSANAYGDPRKALQEEALYLYGSGVATLDGMLWKGEQAEAWTAQANQAFGPAVTLLVRSKAFARQSAETQADQLKQENTGQ